MSAQLALVAASRQLAAAGIEGGATDARRLLAHVLGVPPERLTLRLQDPLSEAEMAAFEAAITARLSRQPVAQSIGKRLVWGREFRVTRDTLDPRPETEILVAAALEEPFAKVLDLGTGTGCILLSLLKQVSFAAGLGTDVSAAALEVARSNAEALGVTGRARLIQADWFSGVGGYFDLITSNPPYIAEAEMADLSPEVREWEPLGALTPGGDGLDAYRAIARGVGARLMPAGRVLVEIGPTQGAAVAALFAAAGLDRIEVRTDMDGRDRVVIARKPVDDAGEGCGLA